MTTYEEKLIVAKDNLLFAMTYMAEYMTRFHTVKSYLSIRQNGKALQGIMDANPAVKEYYTEYTEEEKIEKLFDSNTDIKACWQRLNLFPYYRNNKEFDLRTLDNVGTLDIIKNAPTYAGLYFIGQVTYNKADKQIYCWVKVGKSTCIQSRMNGYKTALTMFDTFDFLQVDKNSLSAKETTYHILLKQMAIAECALNDEWFLVDSDTYDKMQQLGFAIFEK